MGLFGKKHNTTSLLSGAIAYWRPDNYNPSIGALEDLSGNGHNARLGSGTGEDSADPIRLVFSGEKYIYFPGTNGNNLSIPNSGTKYMTVTYDDGTTVDYSSSDSPLIFGNTDTNFAAKKVRKIDVYSDSARTTKVASLDANAMSEPYSSYVDTYSVTWSITRTTGKCLSVVDRSLLLFGDNSYLSVADAPELNFSDTEDFTVYLNYRIYSTPSMGTTQYLVAKGTPGTDGFSLTESYFFTVFTTDNSPGGTANVDFPSLGVASSVGFGIAHDGNPANAGSFLLASDYKVEDTTAYGAYASSTSDLYFGKNPGGANFASMEFFGAAVFDRLLNPEEIRQLGNEFSQTQTDTLGDIISALEEQGTTPTSALSTWLVDNVKPGLQWGVLKTSVANMEVQLYGTGTYNLWWEDGQTSTGTLSSSATVLTHAYSSGTHPVVVLGENISRMDGVTETDNKADWGGDVKNFPRSLDRYAIWGANVLSGDIKDLPKYTTYMDVWGNNTISGDYKDLPPTMQKLSLRGNNTVTATTTTLPKPLSDIRVGGLTSSSEIDNIVIGMAANVGETKPYGTKRVKLDEDGGASRTAASDAAYATLDAAGYTLAVVDSISPNPPTSLSTTAEFMQVSLTWTDATNADLDSVNVKRRLSGSGGYSTIDTVAKGVEGYTDTTVTGGVAYDYVLSSVDIAGNESSDTSPSTVTPIGLPQSGLVSVYEFTSDANDSHGSNNLTLQNGASIIGTGKHGLDLSTNQDAVITSSSVVSGNSDFTIFVAFRWDTTTPPSEYTIVSLGYSSGSDPYITLYLDDGSGNIRLLNKNSSGTFGGTANLALSGTPNGDQLWKVMLSGTTLTMECLTNSTSNTGSVTDNTNYATNQMAFGTSPTGSSYEWYWGGGSTNPIYAGVFYSRAVTDSGEVSNVRSWFQSARGLTGV